MFRKVALALSLVGLFGFGGALDVQPSKGPSITCFDCWEMK